jgi:hypothetical protein
MFFFFGGGGARAPYRFLLFVLYYTNCYPNICRRNFRILWVIHPMADFFFVAASLLMFLEHTQLVTYTTGSTHLILISSSQRPLPTQHERTQEMNILAFIWIRTRDPSNRAASDLRLRLHGHRDRPQWPTVTQIVCRNGSSYHIFHPIIVKPVLNGTWA